MIKNSATLSQMLFGLIIAGSLYSHQEPLSTAISLLCLILLIGRIGMPFFAPKLMRYLSSNTVKNLGALVFTIVILFSARQLGLINAMVNLLVSGAALWWFTLPHSLTADKPTHTSYINNLTLCLFFLFSVGFIYEQTLLFSLLFFANILLIWFAHLIFNNPQFNLKHSFRLFSIFVASSTLTAMLLFLLLPNLSPFWQLPEQQQTTSGISNSMTPGDIASLTSSNRLAFRAAFIGANPLHQDMYWRVLTMPYFDGKTWQAETNHILTKSRSPASDGGINDITATIVAEPSHQSWLYNLSGTYSPTKQVFEQRDDTLNHHKPLTSKLKYQLLDLPKTPIPNGQQPDYFVSHQRSKLTLAQQKQLTVIDTNLHKQTQQQVRKWLPAKTINQGSVWQTTTEFVNSMTSFFRQNAFIYTLQPPALNDDHIDQFLFSTRQGFCAHYASAATVMLRLSGIPSRVVAGYHGGEYNPNGNYFNVYDSAAHAWVEYWLADSANSVDGTWIRFDPTAAIAPERIANGLDRAETLGQANTAQAIDLIKSVPWLNTLRQKLQSLDYYWTIWVLDFDPTRRENRLSSWFQQTSFMTIFITVFVILGLVLVAFFVRSYVKNKKHGITRHLHELEKILNKYNQRRSNGSHRNIRISREPSVTLQKYSEQLKIEFPELAEPLTQLFQLMEQALYQAPTQNDASINVLIEQQIKNLLKTQ